MKKLLVLTAVLCAATAASAQELNWEAAQRPLMTALQDRAPIAAPDADEVGSDYYPYPDAGRLEIMAEPLAASTLAHLDTRFGGSRSVELILNNEKDRVGAEVSACEASNVGDDMPACDRLRFSFPQLRVDQAAKQILLGNEVVASFGGFFGGLRMSKGFKLTLSQEVRKEDRGFNYVLVDSYSVKLERVSK